MNSLSATERTLVRVPAAAAGSGLTVGVLSWLILGPSLGTRGIAIGYLCGAVAISGICLFAAWRRWNQRWGTLLLRVGLAAAVGVALWVVVDLSPGQLWIRLACALAAVTALACPLETRQIIGRLRQVARQVCGSVTR